MNSRLKLLEKFSDSKKIGKSFQRQIHKLPTLSNRIWSPTRNIKDHIESQIKMPSLVKYIQTPFIKPSEGEVQRSISRQKIKLQRFQSPQAFYHSRKDSFTTINKLSSYLSPRMTPVKAKTIDSVPSLPDFTTLRKRGESIDSEVEESLSHDMEGYLGKYNLMRQYDLKFKNISTPVIFTCTEKLGIKGSKIFDHIKKAQF